MTEHELKLKPGDFLVIRNRTYWVGQGLVIAVRNSNETDVLFMYSEWVRFSDQSAGYQCLAFNEIQWVNSFELAAHRWTHA